MPRFPRLRISLLPFTCTGLPCLCEEGPPLVANNSDRTIIVSENTPIGMFLSSIIRTVQENFTVENLPFNGITPDKRGIQIIFIKICYGYSSTHNICFFVVFLRRSKKIINTFQLRKKKNKKTAQYLEQ